MIEITQRRGGTLPRPIVCASITGYKTAGQFIAGYIIGALTSLRGRPDARENRRRNAARVPAYGGRPSGIMPALIGGYCQLRVPSKSHGRSHKSWLYNLRKGEVGCDRRTKSPHEWAV